MNAYENYCLEGILKKWSAIKKDNVKYNTFSEIHDVFGCPVILWCISTVLFILTFILALINIQNKICSLVLFLISFFFFILLLVFTVILALKEKKTNFFQRSRYQSIMPCLKIFLESYANSDELVAYLNKSVSTLNQKYISVTDKVYTFFLSTVVALTISFISNKIDVIFNTNLDVLAAICIIYIIFLFLSYKIIELVAVLFCFDTPSLLNKARNLIDLIDVYNLTIHQSQCSAANI